jgi:hypothetical protein
MNHLKTTYVCWGEGGRNRQNGNDNFNDDDDNNNNNNNNRNNKVFVYEGTLFFSLNMRRFNLSDLLFFQAIFLQNT